MRAANSDFRDDTGSEETLDNTRLMGLWDRLSRRLRAWAAENGIPIRECRVGEHKREIARRFCQLQPSKKICSSFWQAGAPPVW